MARLQRDGDTLVLRLTTGEKIAGLHGDIRVPLSSVADVDVVPDALGAVRGIRAPGLALPGSRMIGTWRGRGERRFVVARRDVPAVRVRLKGADFAELLVATEDAESAAAVVRVAADLNGAGRG